MLKALKQWFDNVRRRYFGRYGGVTVPMPVPTPSPTPAPTPSPTPTPTPTPSVTYDTRWGTSTDANGWITFTLPGGRRRIWCDSVDGNDANNGLTAATAKATFNAAFTLFINGSWGVGDQLMLAGGVAGGSYTDTTSSGLTTHCGTSPSVMTVVQSYDRADPTGATTTYGRVLGAKMPVLNLIDGTSTALTVVNVEGAGYVAVQGIELKGPSTGRAIDMPTLVFQTNNHPGLVYQNCRFNRVSFSTNPATDTNTALTNTQKAGLISKCSQWNCSGVFLESSDNFWFQDFITVHNGWDIGACREDTVTNGGAQVFTHNFYYHASCTNGRFDRVVTVDSSLEGIGARGDIAGASIIVSIDNVVGIGPGGFSGTYLEAPNGINSKWDDVVICGSDNCTVSNPGGWAVEWDNTLLGSYMRNVAVFESPLRGNGSDRYIAGTNASASQVPQYMLCDKWSGWNWGTIEQTSVGADNSKIHLSWSNSTLEMAPSGNLGTVTNCASRSVAPVGYKTRAQTWTAMGFASKAALINAMLYRPDLPWAQAIASISLPAMGLTPQYATVSPPDMTGITPAVVYPVALGNLTMGATSFTRGASSSILLGGTSGNPTLSCADLPSGFTLVGRLLSFDGSGSGSASSTIHVLETSKDTLGTHTTALTVSIASGAAGTTWATNSDYTLTSASLTAERTGTGAFWAMEHASAAKTNGTVIFTIDAIGGATQNFVGFDDGTESANLGNDATGHSIGWRHDGHLFFVSGDFGLISVGAAWTTGDVLKMIKSGASIAFYKNASLLATIDTSSGTYGATNPPSGNAYPSMCSFNATGLKVTADFTGW